LSEKISLVVLNNKLFQIQVVLATKGASEKNGAVNLTRNDGSKMTG